MASNKLTARNFDKKCRLCLRKEGTSPIFNEINKNGNSVLADRITSLAEIQIYPNDGLPGSICHSCRKQVDKFSVFRAVAQISDRILRNNLQKFQNRQIPTKFKEELVEEFEEITTNDVNNDDSSMANDIFVTEEDTVQLWTPSEDNPMGNFEIIEAEEIEEGFEDDFEEDFEETKVGIVQGNEIIILNNNDQQYNLQNDSITDEEDLCCQLCMQVFQSSRELKAHISEHFVMSKSEILNNQCFKVENESSKSDQEDFDTVEAVSLNLESFEENTEDMNIMIKPDPDSNSIKVTNEFTCFKCHAVLATKQEYLLHSKEHTDDDLYKCQFCEKTFTRLYNCKDHEKQHNPQHKYACNECGKSFTKRSALRTHKATHIPEQPRCTICNKNFRNIPSYKTHMKRHTGDDKYICEVCGKNYYNRSELARHSLIHSGKRNHACHLCQMSFFSKPELTRHLKYHTGERKFKCNICLKSYFESTHLKIHERIHTGERPYVCSRCGKAFISKSKLIRHEKIHAKNEMKELEAQYK